MSARTDGLGEFQPNSLVGSYFHSFTTSDDGEPVVAWQGIVIAKQGVDAYLVELFSWLHGHSTVQRLVSVEDMLGWHFYDTAEWMNNTYRDSWEHRSAEVAAA